MTINTAIIVRHALRQDSVDKNWVSSSASPYDPPLALKGFEQAANAGKIVYDVMNNASTSDSVPVSTHIVIHCSPFLRCVQTAAVIAKELVSSTASLFSVTIRIDACFGEWLTEDYFGSITPPPSDNHESLRGSSLAWLSQNAPKGVTIDYTWNSASMGSSGEYGESWTNMHARITAGLESLLNYYNTDSQHIQKHRHIQKPQHAQQQQPSPTTLMVVSHGAACNPLLGTLLHVPILSVIGLASYCVLSTCPTTFTKKKEKYLRSSNNTNISLTNQALTSQDPKRKTELSADEPKLQDVKKPISASSNNTSGSNLAVLQSGNQTPSFSAHSHLPATPQQLPVWKVVCASPDLAHLTDIRSGSTTPQPREIKVGNTSEILHPSLSSSSLSSQSSILAQEPSSSSPNTTGSKLNVYFKSSSARNGSYASINSFFGSKFPKYSSNDTFSCVSSSFTNIPAITRRNPSRGSTPVDTPTRTPNRTPIGTPFGSSVSLLSKHKSFTLPGLRSKSVSDASAKTKLPVFFSFGAGGATSSVESDGEDGGAEEMEKEDSEERVKEGSLFENGTGPGSDLDTSMPNNGGPLDSTILQNKQDKSDKLSQPTKPDNFNQSNKLGKSDNVQSDKQFEKPPTVALEFVSTSQHGETFGSQTAKKQPFQDRLKQQIKSAYNKSEAWGGPWRDLPNSSSSGTGGKTERGDRTQIQNPNLSLNQNRSYGRSRSPSPSQGHFQESETEKRTEKKREGEQEGGVEKEKITSRVLDKLKSTRNKFGNEIKMRDGVTLRTTLQNPRAKSTSTLLQLSDEAASYGKSEKPFGEKYTKGTFEEKRHDVGNYADNHLNETSTDSFERHSFESMKSFEHHPFLNSRPTSSSSKQQNYGSAWTKAKVAKSSQKLLNMLNGKNDEKRMDTGDVPSSSLNSLHSVHSLSSIHSAHSLRSTRSIRSIRSVKSSHSLRSTRSIRSVSSSASADSLASTSFLTLNFGKLVLGKSSSSSSSASGLGSVSASASSFSIPSPSLLFVGGGKGKRVGENIKFKESTKPKESIKVGESRRGGADISQNRHQDQMHHKHPVLSTTTTGSSASSASHTRNDSEDDLVFRFGGNQMY